MVKFYHKFYCGFGKTLKLFYTVILLYTYIHTVLYGYTFIQLYFYKKTTCLIIDLMPVNFKISVLIFSMIRLTNVDFIFFIIKY